MFKLHAFGHPSVVGPDGARLDELPRQTKRFSLLIYLACSERRVHRRDDLLAVFWPESDESCARNCLRQSLHVLRSQLGDGVLVGNGDQEVGIEPGELTSDVGVFLRALRTGSPEAALELYKGDFLSGFYVRELPDFERWVEHRRVELRNLAVSASKQLAYTAEGVRDVTGALLWWRRTQKLAPFDEAVVRRIVSLLIATGNRAEAVRTLTRFERHLKTELEVEPSEPTRALLDTATRGGRMEMPTWFGDRRRERTSPYDGHWRRMTDELSI